MLAPMRAAYRLQLFKRREPASSVTPEILAASVVGARRCAWSAAVEAPHSSSLHVVSFQLARMGITVLAPRCTPVALALVLRENVSRNRLAALSARRCVVVSPWA